MYFPRDERAAHEAAAGCSFSSAASARHPGALKHDGALKERRRYPELCTIGIWVTLCFQTEFRCRHMLIGCSVRRMTDSLEQAARVGRNEVTSGIIKRSETRLV